MKREQIEAQDVIERYLRGDLSDSDAQAFEERLLWDSEVQKQLEVTQRLHDGMRAAAAGPAVAVDAAPGPHAARWPGLLASPFYAMAASVLFVFAALGWFATWQSSAPLPSPAASASVYSLDMMRGAGDRDNWPLVRTGSGWITLLVYPDLTAHPQFRAALARANGDGWQPVWEAKIAATAESDTVALSLPDSLLPGGGYRLRVFGVRDGVDDGIVAEVHFRVDD